MWHQYTMDCAAGQWRKFFLHNLFTDRIFGLYVRYDGFRKQKHGRSTDMKGYYNHVGYMGYVEGRWVLFASESDYREYMEE